MKQATYDLLIRIGIFLIVGSVIYIKILEYFNKKRMDKLRRLDTNGK